MDIKEFVKKGHNSGTLWTELTKLENCGRSLKHNISPLDQPTDQLSAESSHNTPAPLISYIGGIIT